jgi:ABC-type Zn uptake system ZnuABC Zn-binding protein ZnuA
VGFVFVWVAGCADTNGVEQVNSEGGEDNHSEEPADLLTLPQLQPISLNGRALKVVATTSIIGDVVAQVGGGAIELTTLMEPGQDPHSYEPAARDLTLVAEADLILVNGWDLEEALIGDLEQIAENKLILPLSAGIKPRSYDEHAEDDHVGEHDEHTADDHEEAYDEHAADEDDHAHEHHAHDHHGIADPHVWFDIANVEQWVENLIIIFSQVDPSNQATYEDNAQAYLGELNDLNEYVQAQIALIPEEQRYLVTNHEALGYFSQAYGFKELGTVLPAASTLAEPSANELAGLIEIMEEYAVCTIFTETTISDALARTVAAEVASCDQVEIIPIYSGALGPPGSGADNYIEMFRFNVDAIVAGLE